LSARSLWNDNGSAVDFSESGFNCSTATESDYILISLSLSLSSLSPLSPLSLLLLRGSKSKRETGVQRNDALKR
jgi:hypothetical protein